MKFSVQTLPFFESRFKALKKKYPRIGEDLRALATELEAGNLEGAPLIGVQERIIKTRMASRDQQKGKSGGFRVLYYVDTPEKTIYLITLYAKAKQEAIGKKDIEDILKRYPEIF